MDVEKPQNSTRELRGNVEGEEEGEEERLQRQRRVKQEGQVVTKLTSPYLLELQRSLDESRSELTRMSP